MALRASNRRRSSLVSNESESATNNTVQSDDLSFSANINVQSEADTTANSSTTSVTSATLRHLSGPPKPIPEPKTPSNASESSPKKDPGLPATSPSRIRRSSLGLVEQGQGDLQNQLTSNTSLDSELQSSPSKRASPPKTVIIPAKRSTTKQQPSTEKMSTKQAQRPEFSEVDQKLDGEDDTLGTHSFSKVSSVHPAVIVITSTLSDVEGRYLMMDGSYHGQPFYQSMKYPPLFLYWHHPSLCWAIGTELGGASCFALCASTPPPISQMLSSPLEAEWDIVGPNSDFIRDPYFLISGDFPDEIVVASSAVEGLIGSYVRNPTLHRELPFYFKTLANGRTLNLYFNPSFRAWVIGPELYADQCVAQLSTPGIHADFYEALSQPFDDTSLLSEAREEPKPSSFRTNAKNGFMYSAPPPMSIHSLLYSSVPRQRLEQIRTQQWLVAKGNDFIIDNSFRMSGPPPKTLIVSNTTLPILNGIYHLIIDGRLFDQPCYVNMGPLRLHLQWWLFKHKWAFSFSKIIVRGEKEHQWIVSENIGSGSCMAKSIKGSVPIESMLYPSQIEWLVASQVEEHQPAFEEKGKEEEGEKREVEQRAVWVRADHFHIAPVVGESVLLTRSHIDALNGEYRRLGALFHGQSCFVSSSSPLVKNPMFLFYHHPSRCWLLGPSMGDTRCFAKRPVSHGPLQEIVGESTWEVADAEGRFVEDLIMVSA